MERIRSRDGTAIAFERVGSGPPIVFVNGALTDRSSTRPLVEELAEGFATVAFDRRGRGESGDTPPYAAERELEDLAAVIGAFGERANLYGHSSGGVLALEAVLRGLPVRRLVLYEPPFILGDSRPRPSADLADRLDALVELGDQDGAVTTMLREGPSLTKEAIEQLRASPAWARLVALAHTAAYDARITDGCELDPDRFVTFETPTLVLAGDASPDWMRAGTRALADALPNGRLAVLEGQGHGGAREAPALVARTVASFLAEA